MRFPRGTSRRLRRNVGVRFALTTLLVVAMVGSTCEDVGNAQPYVGGMPDITPAIGEPYTVAETGSALAPLPSLKKALPSVPQGMFVRPQFKPVPLVFRPIEVTRPPVAPSPAAPKSRKPYAKVRPFASPFDAYVCFDAGTTLARITQIVTSCDGEIIGHIGDEYRVRLPEDGFAAALQKIGSYDEVLFANRDYAAVAAASGQTGTSSEAASQEDVPEDPADDQSDSPEPEAGSQAAPEQAASETTPSAEATGTSATVQEEALQPVASKAQRRRLPFQRRSRRVRQSRTTSNATHYQLDDGTNWATFISGATNYRDESGLWRPVDNNLRASGRAGYAYENGGNAYKALFRSDPGASDGVRVEQAGTTVAFGLKGASARKVDVQGNKLAYEIADDVTLRYTAGDDCLKEEVVLLSAVSLPQLRFSLALEGLTPQWQGADLQLLDASGKAVYKIPASFMLDAAQAKADVPMRLETMADGSFVLELLPDPSWISDPARAFPIVIDPSLLSLIPTANADAFVSSRYTGNNYNSLLNAGTYEMLVGYCTYYQTRTYLNFGISSLVGKKIHNADVAAYFYRGYIENAATAVKLSLVTSAWGESTVKWSAQPSFSYLGQVNVDVPNWAEWNLTTAISNYAAGGSWNGVMLWVPNEGDVELFKALIGRNDATAGARPYLSVAYNSVPSVTLSAPAGASTVKTRTPELKWTYSDPDGHPLDGSVVEIALCNNPASQAIIYQYSLAGATTSHKVPEGYLPEDGTYWWRVTVYDGLDEKVSPWLSFVVQADHLAEYRCDWADMLPAGRELSIPVTVKNRGTKLWTTAGDSGIYQLIAEVVDGANNVLTSRNTPIPYDLPPNQSAVVSAAVAVPAAGGSYKLRFTMRTGKNVRFDAIGSAALERSVTVQAHASSSISTRAPPVLFDQRYFCFSDFITVTNTATDASGNWSSANVTLGFKVLARDGSVVFSDTDAGYLSGDVAFGGSDLVAATLDIPTSLPPDVYVLSWDMHRTGMADESLNGWFSDFGNPTSDHPLAVRQFGSAPTRPHAGSVDLTTGNLTLGASDVGIPGRGPALSITRTYNSQSAAHGVFGHGWSSNLDVYLEVSADEGIVVLHGANGALLTFRRRFDGSYAPPAGLFYKLTKPAGVWTLDSRGDSIYRFDSAGRIATIADKSGNTLTYGRDTNGRVTTLTDAGGRVVNIAYNIDGLVESVRYTIENFNGVAGATREAITSYVYDGPYLWKVIADPYDAVTNPNGINAVTTYGYSETAWDYAITSVTNAEDETVRYVYSWTSVSRVYDPRSTDTKPIYTQLGYDSDAHTVTITDPRGISQPGHYTTTLRYGSRMDVASSTDALGETTRYYYDEYCTLLAEVTPKDITVHEYDNGGFETKTWTLNQAATDAIGGQYDWVNGRFWLGALEQAKAYEYNPMTGAEPQSAPSANTCQATLQLVQTGNGVVATDGTFLYIKRWNDYAGSREFHAIGTGYNGTTAGYDYGAVTGETADTLGAFWLDGDLYSPGSAAGTLDVFDLDNPTVLLVDDFSDNDIVGWTPYQNDGGTVTASGGQLNLYVPSGRTQNGCSAITGGYTKAGVYVFDFDWTPGPHGNSSRIPGFFITGANPSRDTTSYGSPYINYVKVMLGYYTDTSTRTKIEIEQKDTVVTTLSSVAFSIAQNTTHHVSILFDGIGSYVSVTVDGKYAGKGDISSAVMNVLGGTVNFELHKSGNNISSTEKFDNVRLAQLAQRSVTVPGGFVNRTSGVGGAGGINVLTTTDGRYVYNVSNHIDDGGETYNGWTVRVLDPEHGFNPVTTFDIRGASVYTDGVLCDGTYLYFIEWTHTDSAKVKQVRLPWLAPLDGNETGEYSIDTDTRFMSFEKSEFDSDGNPLSSKDSDGHKVSVIYNAAGDPVNMTDALGNTTIFTYDTYGNTVETVDPASDTVHFMDSFDALSKSWEVRSDSTKSYLSIDKNRWRSSTGSLKLYQTVDYADTYVKKEFAQPLTNVAYRAYFYDDGSVTGTWVFRAISSDGYDHCIGINRSVSTQAYSYRLGTGWSVSTVAPSVGWHEALFRVNSAGTFLYIDGVRVGSSDKTDLKSVWVAALWTTTAPLWADDVSVYSTLPPENAGFEGSNTSGVPIDWTSNNLENSTATYAVDTGTFRSGVKSAKITKTNPDGYSFLAGNAKLQKGVKYLFSAYVKCSGVSKTGEFGAQVGVRVPVLGGNGYAYYSSRAGTRNDGWERLHCSFTLPADAPSDTVQLRLYLSHETGTVWFDDARVDPWAASTIEYDPTSSYPIRTIDAVGGTTTFTYDSVGTLVSTTVQATLPSTSRYEYDSLGRMVCAYQPDGSVVRTEYDKVGRAVRVITEKPVPSTRKVATGGTSTDANVNVYPSVRSLVRDSRGTLHAVWANFVTREVLYTCSPDDGVTWSAPQVLGTSVNSVSQPYLKIDGNDRVHVFWSEYYSDNIWSNHRFKDYGGTWSATNLVGGTHVSNEVQYMPNPAIDASGNLSLVFDRCHYLGVGLKTWNGTSWSSTSLATSTMYDHQFHNTLPVGSDLYTFYYRTTDGFLYMTKRVSGVWSAPTAVSSVSSVHHSEILDSDGKIWVFNTDYTATYKTVQVRTYVPSTNTWSAWTTLDSEAGKHVYLPSATLDDAGNVWVFYNIDDEIFYQTWDRASGTWSGRIQFTDRDVDGACWWPKARYQVNNNVSREKIELTYRQNTLGDTSTYRLYYATLAGPQEPGETIESQSIYEDGYLVRTIDPLGTVTAFEYDDAGNRVKTIGDVGGLELTSTVVYDELNRVTSVTNAEDKTTTYTYEGSDGQVKGVTDPNGNTTTTQYDAQGRPTIVTDALGNVSRTVFGGNGVAGTIDPTDDANPAAQPLTYAPFLVNAGTTVKGITTGVSTHDGMNAYSWLRSLVRDTRGGLHAVWSDSAAKNLYYITSTDGGSTWTAPVVLASSGSSDLWQPTIKIDSADRIHVLWSQTSSDYYQYYHRYKDYGGAWSSTSSLASSPGIDEIAFMPNPAIDSSGNLQLVYDESHLRGIGLDTFNGTAWSGKSDALTAAYDHQYENTLAIGSDLYYFFRKNADGFLYMARRVGGVWSAPVAVSSVSSPYHNEIVDADGKIWVFNSDYSAAVKTVLVSTYTPSANTWSAWSTLDSEPSVDVQMPSATLDASGDIWVFYNVGDEIFYKMWDRGTGVWSGRMRLTDRDTDGACWWAKARYQTYHHTSADIVELTYRRNVLGDTTSFQLGYARVPVMTTDLSGWTITVGSGGVVRGDDTFGYAGHSMQAYRTTTGDAYVSKTFATALKDVTFDSYFRDDRWVDSGGVTRGATGTWTIRVTGGDGRLMYLGINTATSADKYVYNVDGTWRVSRVARTLGWHKVSYRVSAGGTSIFVDGVFVVSTASTSLSSVLAGNVASSVTTPIWFDEPVIYRTAYGYNRLGMNVAAASRGAVVSGMNVLRPEILNDASVNAYGTTYATSRCDAALYGPHYFLITLPQSCAISTFRLLMWDGNGPTAQHWGYTILASEDGINWKTVVVNDEARGWQEHAIEPMSMRFIKLVGTYSINGNFHPIEFEAYVSPQTTSHSYDNEGAPTVEMDGTGNVTRTYYDGAGRVVWQADENGNGIAHQYDACGREIATIDSLGGKVTRTYNTAGELVSITNQVGGTSTATYDTSGRTATTRDTVGHQVDFLYDDFGRLASRTSHRMRYDEQTSTWVPDLDITSSYVYDKLGRVLSSIDALHQATTYVYENAGTRISTSDPLTHTTVSNYNRSGRLETQIDPLGVVNRYTYDANGNLVALTLDPTAHDASETSQTTSFHFDANNQLDWVTDARGNAPGANPEDFRTWFEYDANGNKIAMTDSRGTTRFVYDNDDRLVGSIDPLGNINYYRYDAEGKLLGMTSPAAANWVNVALGAPVIGPSNPTALTDGNSTVYDGSNGYASTTWNTSPPGIMTITLPGTYALERVRLKLWDESVAVGENSVRYYQYRLEVSEDSVRWTPVVDKTTGEWRSWEDDTFAVTPAKYIRVIGTYNSANSGFHVVELEAYVNTANNHNWYDAEGRMTHETDSTGRFVIHAYDLKGRRISTTYPDGRLISYTYDSEDRLTRVSESAGAVWVAYVYDSHDNVVKVSDSRGAVVTMVYDAVDQMIEWRSGTDAVFHTYDADGRVETKRVERSGVVLYTESYGYDNADRVLSIVTTPGTGSPIQDVTYTYFGSGNIESMSDAVNGALYEYTYDAAGELASERRTDALGWRLTTYMYDGNGNRTNRTEYVSALLANSSFETDADANGVADSWTTSNMGYSTPVFSVVSGGSNGAQAQRVQITGVTGDSNKSVYLTQGCTAGALDARDVITFSVALKGTRTGCNVDVQVTAYRDGTYLNAYTTTSNVSLTTAWQRFSVTMSSLPATTNRILCHVRISAVDPGDTADVYVDAAQLEKKASASGYVAYDYTKYITDYTYNAANQLTSGGWTWDVCGNATSNGTYTFEWDGQNRLTAIKQGGVTVASYAYDAEGMRTVKIAGTNTERYVIDERNNQVIAILDAAGAEKVRFLRDDEGGLVAMRKADGTTLYYVTNEHGDVVALLDAATDTLVARWSYDAWGNPTEYNAAGERVAVGTAGNPYLYASYFYDTESSYYYLQARYYDASTGRFLSVDPDPGDDSDRLSLNPYIYCENNCVNDTDPDGHGFWSWARSLRRRAVSYYRRTYSFVSRSYYRVRSTFSRARSWVSNRVSAARRTVRRFARSVRRAVSRSWRGVKRWASRSYNRAKNWVKSTARRAVSAVKNTARRAANAVKSAAKKAAGAARKAGAAIKSAAKWAGSKEGLATIKKGLAVAGMVVGVAALVVGTVATGGALAAGLAIAGAGIAVAGAAVGEVQYQKGYISNTERWMGHAGAALSVVGAVGAVGSLGSGASGAAGLADDVANNADEAAGFAGGICFVAGTLVLTSTGLTRIEQIRVGDFVVSRDDATGVVSLKRVVQTFVRRAAHLVRVNVAGEEIICTPTHPFWVVGRGWVEAEELIVGEQVILADGSLATIGGVREEARATPVDVYNFEVADFHTYFVGRGSVWVHNSCAQQVDDVAGAVEPPTAIGKVPDLDAAEAAGENFQRLRLPNQGSARANWSQNSSVLRAEMRRGLPIMDKSFNPVTGELANNTGFLSAERAVLSSRGWTYDPTWTQWVPPR